MTKTSLKLPSFAKINWYLRILGKRPDGYHEVVTVLQTISLATNSRSTVDGEEGLLTVTCDDPAIPTDNTNLIIKAAGRFAGLSSDGRTALKSHSRRESLRKGGLGGASSNAAVTLTGPECPLARGDYYNVDELMDRR